MNPADLTGGSALYMVGDVRDVLATIPDHSIDLVVTSPPFLALRSYLPADHPDKHREIGSEPTPADFLDTLLELSAEWRRVLAPHGSIAVELGDTYSGSSNDGGPQGNGISGNGGARWRDRLAGNINDQPRKGAGWPLDKSLTGIPTLYAWSLAYGRNLLTGMESPAGRWRVRNVIPWVRPNPPVGALGDKCRPATSYITVATLARDRWWDMEDCRTTLSTDRKADPPGVKVAHGKTGQTDGNWSTLGRYNPTDSAGAPLLDWWQIPTAPYPGAHYATFPPELPARLTKLMCPREVCRVCGEPRRRILGEPEYVQTRTGGTPAVFDMREGIQVAAEVRNWSANGAAKGDNGVTRTAETLGWTDCGHNDYRPGIVLDPFAGTGTTLAAATGLGRAAIGIDLDHRNVDLARQRCGMFLEVAA